MGIQNDIDAVCERAKAASRALAALGSEEKNRALKEMAKGIIGSKSAIMKANAEDLENARKANIPKAFLDRLTLNEKRPELQAAPALYFSYSTG